jgi:AraC-like DNA-binding protein
MQARAFAEDSSWSSAGLNPHDAISQWRRWANQTLAPIDVDVRETEGFTAQWRSRGLGPLCFVQMGASAQHVIHANHLARSSQVEATFQLVYSRRGAFKTRTGRKNFVVQPGEFVLLDNSRFYQMDLDDYHEAIDLVMPQNWLEHWLPDPLPLLDRPISVRHGWGTPLGSLLDTMADHLDGTTFSRRLMAGQLGSLLSLLTDSDTPLAGRHRSRLTRRILRVIEQNYTDPELTLDIVANEFGISKRYVHALLAEQGTSFVQALNSVRIEHAAELLKDPRLGALQVSEIAWQCGFVDAGYFARLFRRRFDVGPRSWRARHLTA